MQAGKRNHVLPFTVYSHHTGCLHCAPSLDISHALVSLNTVNVFIRQNRTFKKSPSVLYLYIYLFFSPSPSTVAVAYQYVSVGSWSLLFLFVFRKHGRPCDTTWPGTDKLLTNAVARQTHPYQRRGRTECYVYAYCTLQIARMTARWIIGWVIRTSRVQKTRQRTAGNRSTLSQCCHKISFGQNWFAAFKVYNDTYHCTVKKFAS